VGERALAWEADSSPSAAARAAASSIKFMPGRGKARARAGGWRGGGGGRRSFGGELRVFIKGSEIFKTIRSVFLLLLLVEIKGVKYNIGCQVCNSFML
jgi:hypothetical protein